MLIGIDLDDTIAATFEPYFVYAHKWCLEKEIINFNTTITIKNYHNVEDMLNMTDKQKNKFELAYHNQIIANVYPKTLAKTVLSMLANDNHQIFILTARSNITKQTQLITKKWLKYYKLTYHKLIFDCNNKAQACKAYNIQCFLDNDPKNCLAVSNSGITTYIFHTYWNQNFTNKKVKRVYSWWDFYQQIQKAQI